MREVTESSPCHSFHDESDGFSATGDVDAIRNTLLDLSSMRMSKAQASEIYERLEEGTMPCECTLARRASEPLQAMDGRRHAALNQKHRFNVAIKFSDPKGILHFKSENPDFGGTRSTIGPSQFCRVRQIN